jgi:hypothetical protein
MRRHHQTGQTDCFRTCIACLLDYDSPEDVPDWYRDVPPGDTVPDSIIAKQDGWFAERGLRLIETRFSDTDPGAIIGGVGHLHPGLPFILVGMGSREQPHAAIYNGAGLLHDPWPSVESGVVPGVHSRLINGTVCYFSVYHIALNLGDPYWVANLVRNLVQPR